MPCRRWLFSKTMAVIITLTGMTASPCIGRAQTTSRVTEEAVVAMQRAKQRGAWRLGDDR